MKTSVLALIAGAALSLGGCVSVLPTPVIPSALISLPADRATAPADPLQADVGVYRPDSSRAFAGSDIAVRDNQEIIYLSDVRWSDAGPALMQDAVVNALAKGTGPGKAFPGNLGAETDYDLRWRIIDLSTGKGTSPVRVEVQASLMDSGTRRTIAQQSFSSEGSPADDTARGRAAALALVAQKVADEVAEFVARTAVAQPALAPVTPAATPQ